MMKYFSLITLLPIVLFGSLDAFRLRAQESPLPSSIGTWTDAVKQLDSMSSEDAKRGEAWLRQELAKEETPVEAAWALALFCIKRGDLSALERTVKAIGQRYPNPPVPVAIAIERMRLSIALSKEDAAAAETAIEKIAKAALDGEISKEDRQLNATSIGAIVGMLEAEAAQSPIAFETLHRIKETLAAIKKDDVGVQFELAYESSRTKAAMLADRFAAIADAGLQPVQAEQQELMNEYAALGKSIEEAEESLRLTKLNTEEQTKANRVSIKRIQAYLVKLERDWKTPTPGHPGPEKPAPIKPLKSTIQVDEYEYVNETVTETDTNGNRVQRTRKKEVRRPQAEIDREREFKYARLMEIYRFHKAEYDAYITKYRTVLDTWIQADRDRRDNMQQDKRDSLQKAADLNKQIDALEEERVAAVKNVAALRAQQKTLRTEGEIVAEVLRTAAIKKPESSFRPGFFETVFVGKEKSRLLKVYQESIR